MNEATDQLFARLGLIARAEEQAATASEQAHLAETLGSEALESAGVLSLAIEQVSRTHATLCERLARAADAEGDVLLARALSSLAASLQTASRNAAAAAIEAHDFDEALAAERQEAGTSKG